MNLGNTEFNLPDITNIAGTLYGYGNMVIWYYGEERKMRNSFVSLDRRSDASGGCVGVGQKITICDVHWG